MCPCDYIVKYYEDLLWYTAKPKVIITGDEKVQGTETYQLKANIDKALKESGHEVERVFVASRTGKEVPVTPGRDVSLEEVLWYSM